MQRFYLDANATYGILPEVRAALEHFLRTGGEFWNPSAVHQEGQSAHGVLDRVRMRLVQALGVSSSDHEIVFSSGATEANNATLLAPFLKLESGSFRGHIVSTTVEHPSVEEVLRRLEQLGVTVSRVRISSDVESSLRAVLDVVTSETTMLSVMWANNENGVIHPVPEIFRAVKDRFPNCLLHTDAVQYFSKCQMDLSSLPFDVLTLAPHKFGALPGVGISLYRRAAGLSPLLVGGAQEQRHRAGTENMLGVFSVESALDELPTSIARYESEIRPLRDTFELAILKRYPSASIVGAQEKRLPNTSLLYLPGISTEDLVVALDLEGVACSRGSACSSGKQLGSHVLAGMGYPESAGREVLRFSFRADFPPSSLDSVLERIFLCFERSGIATR
jgi:cysteine desulfurase